MAPWAIAPRWPDFALLLEYVAEIPGIERLRFTTSHPNEFTLRLIEAYAGQIPQLVSHLPAVQRQRQNLMVTARLQSAMGIQGIGAKLQTIRPDMAMSSDFIVGFPGETEDDFKK